MAVIDVRENVISLPEYKVEQPARNRVQEVMAQPDVLENTVSGSQVEVLESGEIDSAEDPLAYARVTPAVPVAADRDDPHGSTPIDCTTYQLFMS